MEKPIIKPPMTKPLQRVTPTVKLPVKKQEVTLDQVLSEDKVEVAQVSVPTPTPIVAKPIAAKGNAAFDFTAFKAKSASKGPTKPEPLMLLLTGKRGGGKCHDPNQGILMFDGSVKKAKDIEIGDQLMGPDSEPRNVLQLFKGEDNCFKITLKSTKESFYVTEDHKFPIIVRINGRNVEETLSVRDILNKYQVKLKTSHVLLKRSRGIEFPFATQTEDLPLDPYWLGLWIGDGSCGGAQITKPDKEIFDWCKDYYAKCGYETKVSCNSSGCLSFNPVRKFLRMDERQRIAAERMNYFRSMLKELEIIDYKRIPQSYLTACFDSRLKLLAGLLDTDGYKQADKQNNCYELTCKNEELKDEVVFLCRSLGLKCSWCEKIVLINNKQLLYYRMYISGDNLSCLPINIERKKPSIVENIAKTDKCLYGFDLEEIGIQPYCGFECDGDRLYLLDNFFISHNSYSGGSCNGDVILFCSRQEHHSYQAALACNKKLKSPHSITPMWMDFDEDKGEIIESPDKVWDRVLDRLEALINTPNVAELFPFLFFDGLNSIERYVMRLKRVEIATQFQKNTVATATLIELIVDKFLRLREKGVNIICTMASEVKEKPDGSLTLVPAMTGYRAADEILGSFPDIGVATSIQMENEEGLMVDTHVFQFKNAEGIKTGKKFNGETAMSTFNPRLQSIPKEYLPVYLDANISGLITFINDTFESMSAQETKTEGVTE